MLIVSAFKAEARTSHGGDAGGVYLRCDHSNHAALRPSCTVSDSHVWSINFMASPANTEGQKLVAGAE